MPTEEEQAIMQRLIDRLNAALMVESVCFDDAISALLNVTLHLCIRAGYSKSSVLAAAEAFWDHYHEVTKPKFEPPSE